MASKDVRVGDPLPLRVAKLVVDKLMKLGQSHGPNIRVGSTLIYPTQLAALNTVQVESFA